MMSLLRGWLPFTLAMACMPVVLQPVSAQFQQGMPNNPPPGFNMGNPPGNNFQGTQPNNPFQPGFSPNPGPTVNTVSAGMIVCGLFLITLGLGLMGGVIYLGIQGQKTTYEGGSGLSGKKSWDYDD